MTINDGTGSGFMAAVSNTHRLLVDADSHDASLTAATDGKSFSVSSGSVTLTSASSSALIFLKNEEESNLIFSVIRFQANQSTGGANGTPTWEIIRNPTTGTIISGASVVTPVNTNFGSTATIKLTAYKGVEGNTFTDGTVLSTHFGVPVPHRFFLEVAGYVLPRGSAIGVRVTPPTGNTSMLTSVSFRVFLNSPLFSSLPA